MIQQYELMRKENDLLNSLVGQSFNQRTKFEAEKIMKQIHSKAKARSLDKMALCYVHEQGEIKGVGGSSLMRNKKTGEIQSNLILNNLGQALSGIFKGGVLVSERVIVDSIGVGRNTRFVAPNVLFNDTLIFRVLLQVGSGSTAPARTDFAIETAFGTGPEDTFFESTIPIYDNSNFNFKNAGSISAGGSGTVNESVLQAFWSDAANGSRVNTLYRDAISPGVPFVASQTIALEYTTQI